MEQIEKIIRFGFANNISRNSRPQYIKFIEEATTTKMRLWHPFARVFPRLNVCVNEKLAVYVDLLEFSIANISRFIPLDVAQELMRQFERDGEGVATVQGLIEEWPWRFDAGELHEIGIVREHGGRIVFYTVRARCYIPVYNWEAQAEHIPSFLLDKDIHRSV